MKNILKYSSFLFVISITFLVQNVFAQSHVSRGLKSEDPRIIFYEHPNYTGHTLPVYGAGEISDLHKKDRGATGDWNDRISSIEFEGNFKLTIYSDADYSGKSTTITTSQITMFSLDNFDWDNKVSSIRWEATDPDQIKPQALFYESPNYKGRSFILNLGNQIRDLREKKRGSRLRDWNDEIRSVRFLGSNVGVVLFENRKYGGSRVTISQNTPDLSKRNFSKRASSLKVVSTARSN